MSGSKVACRPVKISISNKDFHVVRMNGKLPVELQPCCTGMLILEPTPFIQLVQAGKEEAFCDEYVLKLESCGESDAQIARFRRHALDMAQVVYWCAPDTLLVPEELCKPVGNIITAKCTGSQGVRLVEGFSMETEGM